MTTTAQHLLDARHGPWPRVEVVETQHGTYAVALLLDGSYVSRSDAEHQADFHRRVLSQAVQADTGQSINLSAGQQVAP